VLLALPACQCGVWARADAGANKGEPSFRPQAGIQAPGTFGPGRSLDPSFRWGDEKGDCGFGAGQPALVSHAASRSAARWGAA